MQGQATPLVLQTESVESKVDEIARETLYNESSCRPGERPTCMRYPRRVLEVATESARQLRKRAVGMDTPLVVRPHQSCASWTRRQQVRPKLATV